MMSKNLISWCFCLFFLFATRPLSAQQADYNPPELDDSNSWSLVIFPDTQSYAKFGRNQPILDLMTQWVVENVKTLNIQLVLHVGDLVEHNAIVNPDGLEGNQTGREQWEAVAASMGAFDGKVPFIATTGNHDFGIKNVENRQTFYNEYFPIEKNSLTRNMLREHALDEDGMPTLTNAAYEFLAPDGKKFLIMVLEFAPREMYLNWAKEIVSKAVYQDHKVILLNHSYLNRQSEYIESENYPLEDKNYGKAVWEKLVKPSTNIQMVFSGHIGAPDEMEGHVGFRTDLNAAGEKVHQMTFNAQAMGGGWQGNGGDGWLRWLEISGTRVMVKTFSPLFAISPSTQHLAWGTGAYKSFTFDLE